jgi:hypothetical protein
MHAGAGLVLVHTTHHHPLYIRYQTRADLRYTPLSLASLFALRLLPEVLISAGQILNLSSASTLNSEAHYMRMDLLPFLGA